MTLTITSVAMTSDTTSHIATHDPETNLWRMSWPLARQLDRNAAITAMTVAELIASGVRDVTHADWPLMRVLASELDLSGTDAVHVFSKDPTS